MSTIQDASMTPPEQKDSEQIASEDRIEQLAFDEVVKNINIESPRVNQEEEHWTVRRDKDGHMKTTNRTTKTTTTVSTGRQAVPANSAAA